MCLVDSFFFFMQRPSYIAWKVVILSPKLLDKVREGVIICSNQLPHFPCNMINVFQYITLLTNILILSYDRQVSSNGIFCQDMHGMVTKLSHVMATKSHLSFFLALHVALCEQIIIVKIYNNIWS